MSGNYCKQSGKGHMKGNKTKTATKKAPKKNYSR